MSAGSLLEGWGLWLRSGSAGALLYKGYGLLKDSCFRWVSVRSGCCVAFLAVYTLGNGLLDAILIFF